MLSFTPYTHQLLTVKPKKKYKNSTFTSIYNYFLASCFLSGCSSTRCFISNPRNKDLSKLAALVNV